MRNVLLLAAAAAMIPAMAAAQGKGKAANPAKHGQHMSKGNAASKGKAASRSLGRYQATSATKSKQRRANHGAAVSTVARTTPPGPGHGQAVSAVASQKGAGKRVKREQLRDLAERNRNKVTGLTPFLGAGFSPGQPLPAGYDVYNVPIQYRNAFRDSDSAHYRYGDGAIYQIDPKTRMINGVAALLAKDNFQVGAALPTGYDSYNLPMQLRSQYPDTSDNLFRYANGNIYQADAKTRIITSIISAL